MDEGTCLRLAPPRSSELWWLDLGAPLTSQSWRGRSLLPAAPRPPPLLPGLVTHLAISPFVDPRTVSALSLGPPSAPLHFYREIESTASNLIYMRRHTQCQPDRTPIKFLVKTHKWLSACVYGNLSLLLPQQPCSPAPKSFPYDDGTVRAPGKGAPGLPRGLRWGSPGHPSVEGVRRVTVGVGLAGGRCDHLPKPGWGLPYPSCHMSPPLARQQGLPEVLTILPGFGDNRGQVTTPPSDPPFRRVTHLLGPSH